MEFGDIIWLIVVIVAAGLKIARRTAANKTAQQEQEQELAPEPGPETPGESAAVFAYYYTREGQKKVDAVKSAKASGRELTEYEIYSEQQRLDKLWCQELERQEAEETEYIPPEPVETPDMQEIMACARSGAAEHVDAQPSPVGNSSDREYQLQQLERWLEAGLIDKAEYKKRKREL